MNRVKYVSAIAPCLALVIACSGEPAPDGTQPTTTAVAASALDPSSNSLCAAADFNLEGEEGKLIAEVYVRNAWYNPTKCSIDEYFAPAALLDENLTDYFENQLNPWLLRFWGCPNPGHETVPRGEGFSAIGLIPAHDPPFTITATDYYMIVNVFMESVAECIFQFTPDQLARINLMLYELAPFVINDYRPGVGLTHSDPLGTGACVAYDPPFNILTGCTSGN